MAINIAGQNLSLQFSNCYHLLPLLLTSDENYQRAEIHIPKYFEFIKSKIIPTPVVVIVGNLLKWFQAFGGNLDGQIKHRCDEGGWDSV